MKGRRHSEEQIIKIPQAKRSGSEDGRAAPIARHSENVFYRWKAKYDRLKAS